MFKELLASEILLHPEVRAQVVHQIAEFRPVRRDNSDGILDLLTYARRVLESYGQYLVVNSAIGIQEIGNANVLSAVDNCSY